MWLPWQFNLLRLRENLILEAIVVVACNPIVHYGVSWSHPSALRSRAGLGGAARRGAGVVEGREHVPRHKDRRRKAT